MKDIYTDISFLLSEKLPFVTIRTLIVTCDYFSGRLAIYLVVKADGKTVSANGISAYDVVDKLTIQYNYNYDNILH